MHTPIPRILLAVDGKVAFVTKTSPFLAPAEPADKDPSHETVEVKIKEMFGVNDG